MKIEPFAEITEDCMGEIRSFTLNKLSILGQTYNWTYILIEATLQIQRFIKVSLDIVTDRVVIVL